VVFAYAAIYSLKISAHHFDAINEIPKNVLIAMGMSVISAAAAKSITVSYISTGRITKSVASSGSASFSAIFQDDSGFPDLSKVQMIAWTFIAIVTYLIAVGSKIHQRDYSSLPDIDSALMVLIGLGHGAYLGKKLVTQNTTAPIAPAAPAAPQVSTP
jgi:hypothetical protein